MKIIVKIQPSRGFSLVEVLIASAVFSMGLGGLSLMMLTSVHGTVEARNQTTAAMQAASLAELILLNPSAMGHEMYPQTGPVENCDGGSCDNADWAAGNLAQWQTELEQGLARATGLVCRDATPNDGEGGDPACDGLGQTIVKVFWNEPKHRDDPDGGLHRLVLPAGK